MGSVQRHAVTSPATLPMDTEAVGPCQGRAFQELQLYIVFLSNFLIIWMSLAEALSELHRMLPE